MFVQKGYIYLNYISDDSVNQDQNGSEKAAWSVYTDRLLVTIF